MDTDVCVLSSAQFSGWGSPGKRVSAWFGGVIKKPGKGQLSLHRFSLSVYLPPHPTPRLQLFGARDTGPADPPTLITCQD